MRNKMNGLLVIITSLILPVSCPTERTAKIHQYIDESASARAMYFSWINHAWEGANEEWNILYNLSDAPSFFHFLEQNVIKLIIQSHFYIYIVKLKNVKSKRIQNANKNS